MKPVLISWFVFMLSLSGHAQQLWNAPDTEPPLTYDNVHVTRLFGDSLSTSFMIWIKDTVATHRHDYHSETIYVLEGEGKFYFNDEVWWICPNDVFFIPKQNWHAVKVTSAGPMKVISIQSPGFFGKDRIFKVD
jgi:quercetin dioxygenase-like cupin family protein